MRHPFRGPLAGPLAAPVAFWVVSAAHARAIGGAAFGEFVRTQSGDMFRIWLPWRAGAIVGASVAGTCWIAGRGRP